MGKISEVFLRIQKVFFFGIFGIICLSAGLGLLQKAAPLGRNINLYCQKNSITAAYAAKIRQLEAEKENSVSFTVWTQKEEMLITDSEGYHSAVTNVIELNGSSEHLIPYGRFLQEEDTNGCLIGQAAAQKLFVSTAVEGMSIWYGERLLTIRGVLKEPSDILLVEASEAASFDRITLQKQRGVTKSMQGRRFCENYGITAEFLRMDFFSSDQLSELVPGKWSDFDGWSRNFQTFWHTVRLALSAGKSEIEIAYLVPYCGGLAMILLGICNHLLTACAAGALNRKNQ